MFKNHKSYGKAALLLSLMPLAGTLFAQAPTEDAEGSAPGLFYTDTTFVILILLSILFLVIAYFLYRVKSHLDKIIEEKAGEEHVPGYYHRTFKPWLRTLNPTVASLAIGTLLGLTAFVKAYKFGMHKVGVQQSYSPTQPINYSHKLHAGKLQIDCKYCHATVEKSKQASIPSANTCMNCHKYVTLRDRYDGEVSPEIAKIYKAIGWDSENNAYIPGYKQKPIEWVRIHNLPDLAYFNHSQHVKVGKLECQTCHGPIEEMDKVYQYSSLQMNWCINCHKEKGIDVANNKYYEDLHKRLKMEGKTVYTVADNGGLECGKCHY
ncbi:MAG: cytochrome c3 family protein [Flavobacteriales bacterium]|nr:cytochrome c3 family protein [Flavobacteriales bacterium]